MSLTYDYKVNSFTVAPSLNNLENVVVAVNFVVSATNGTETKDYQSSVNMAYPSPEHFIDFNNLTEAETVEWVKTSINTAAVEANLAAKFNEQPQEPNLIQMPVPWN